MGHLLTWRLTSAINNATLAGWRTGKCLQRESPGRVPTRMRGEDMQRAAPPALTEESGPLVGTSKDGAGHRWRDGRPLDRNTGTGPAVMILPWNIIELALDFHGDGLAGPPIEGLAPCLGLALHLADFGELRERGSCPACRP